MFRPISLKIKNLMSHNNTVYVFDRGIPKLIYGENLDDPGQEGNGSGKSGFTEAISISIIGKMVRSGVKISELIKDGEDECVLELVLHNTKNDKELHIERKIYRSEHKSQECVVRYGEEVITKSRVTDYSTWILEEIGISEEDFKSYYIVTQENYNPFFGLTSLGKQSMVNRFSGADKVDLADPFIKKDVTEKDQEIKKLQEISISLKSKQEVYVNQLLELDKKGSQEEKDRLIESIQVEIKNTEVQISNFETNILPSLYEGVSEIESEIEKREKEIDITVLDRLTAEGGELKSKLEQIKNQVRESRLSISERFRVHKEKHLTPLVTRKEEINKQISEERVTINKLNQKLESTIECPKCDFHFDLKDEDFNYQETIDLVEEKTEWLSDLEKELEQVKNDILELEPKLVLYQEELEKEVESFRKKEEEVESLIQEKRKEVNTFELKKQEVQVVRNSLKLKHQEVEGKESEYLKLNERLIQFNKQIEEVSKGDPVTEKLKEQTTLLLDTCNNDLKENENSLVKKNEERQEVEKWLLLFKSFKSHLANKSIKNIEDYTNLFLSNFKTNLGIKIDGYKDMGKGKLKETITTTVLRGGFGIGNYSRFSLGERTRLDLANILSLQELMNINAKNGLDLLICDDVLNGVDIKGVESIMESVGNISKTIFIVTQHYISSQSKNTLIFRKEGGSTQMVTRPLS